MPIGNIGEFKHESEDWSTYKTRLTSWLLVNDIAEADKRKAALIAVLGGNAVGLLVSLNTPDAIEDKSYDELIRLFDGHFGARNEVAEAYVFDTRTQSSTESVSDFVLALKTLSTHCNFGPTAQLKQKLRNRLVAGVRSDTIRQALIREGAALTWDNAVALAKQMDDYQSSAMAKQSVSFGPVAGINAVQSNKQNQMRGPAAHRSQASNDRAPRLGPPSTRAKYSNSNRNDYVASTRCWRCGKDHTPDRCRFREANCHLCGKRGHIRPMCKEHRAQANVVDQYDEGELSSDFDNIDVADILVAAKAHISNPYSINVRVNDVDITMEIDTGASVSLIPFHMYRTHFSGLKLHRSNVNFCSFTGDVVKCDGRISVMVKHFGQTRRLWLHVLGASRFALLGRDWLGELRIDWQTIKSVVNSQASGIDNLLVEYSDIFQGQGLLKGSPVKLELVDGATPKRSKPYRVPIALQSTVDREIDRLENEGILTPVEHSNWSTSLLFVPKPDGSVRPCGNFKATVNPLLKEVAPPQINMENILCDLAGNKYFSNLDFAQAYNQMVIDESSRELLTLVTHRGLYQYTRLPYGIKTAPSLWQRAVELVLSGIEGIHIYYDDILVAGRTVVEHNHRLELVFKRIKEYGLKLKRSKCSFLKSSVSYLGHIISEEGTKPIPSKLDSILQTEAPRDKSKVRSYVGMLNFYRRYLPDLAATVAPLNALLKLNARFIWDERAKCAFERSKNLLKASKLLVHYDPNLPVKLTCDASRVGVAAVLSHIVDGEERPIQFASQKLTPAQVMYPQIEREGLAIIFGLDKFRHFIYGRKFILVTDNQALSKIFDPERGLPVMTAERIQRWALKLSGYDYTVEWRRSSENRADFLSRYPDPVGVSDLNEEQQAFIFKVDDLSLPITSSQVAKATSRDAELCKVQRLVLEGWPHKLCEADRGLSPFFVRKDELSVMAGVVMWGNRVVIPQSFRKDLLRELHREHLGISKMKSVARSFMWWPGLDKDIEVTSKSCDSCMATSNDPKVDNTHPWLPTSRPYQRIHIDYAGPVEGNMLLVVVDSFSKWPEVVITKSTTAQSTINKLRSNFARWGVPEVLVSDNGPQFSSGEFASFMAHLGVRHKRGAPYHPATNGLAERFVQTVKSALKASSSEGLDMQYRLDRFLLAYRNAPHTTTGESPANLMLGRRLRNRLDCLKPDILSKQMAMGPIMKPREFGLGSDVWVRCYLGAEKWKKGVIIDQVGPLCYYVEVEGRKWKRHVDQLKDREGDIGVVPNYIDNNVLSDIRVLPFSHLPCDMISRNTDAVPQSPQPVSSPQMDVVHGQVGPPPGSPITSQTVSSPSSHTTTLPELRRSSRVRKPRVILGV